MKTAYSASAICVLSGVHQLDLNSGECMVCGETILKNKQGAAAREAVHVGGTTARGADSDPAGSNSAPLPLP